MRAKWSNQNFKKRRIPYDKNLSFKITKQKCCQIDCDLNCETQYSILRDNYSENSVFFPINSGISHSEKGKDLSFFFHEGKQLCY